MRVRASDPRVFSPLAGIRVLDFTTSLAGPYCTLMLGALGADVVKIEHPERGDDTRYLGAAVLGDESAAFLAANASKRSLARRRRSSPEGLEIAAARSPSAADVFVQNMRPGLAERIGLGFEALKERQPTASSIARSSAFGTVGPLREHPATTHSCRPRRDHERDGRDRATSRSARGVSSVDQGTGMWAVIAILAALRARDQGAGAQLVETSLYETAVNWLAYQLAGYLGSGNVPRPLGTALGMIAPYQAFEAADGWLMIAAGNDRQFAALCRGARTPGLAERRALPHEP